MAYPSIFEAPLGNGSWRQMPRPTMIECIAVKKSYDLCFTQEHLQRQFRFTRKENPCIINCLAQFSSGPGSPVPCRLGQTTCREVKRTPAHDGFASVTLLVSFEVVLSPISAKPKHPKKPCVVETFIMTHHVTLCAPAGVDITCRASGECRCTLVDRVLSKPCPIIDELLVDCELDLCLLVQAKADVNLLVPSYGTCEASLCETRERPCPPPAITR